MANIVSTLVIDGSDHVNPVEGSDGQLFQDLSKFWETESIGIVDQTPCVIEQFPKVILFNWTIGRYEIVLPWKSDVRPLSNCHALCVNRLNQLYKRLHKNRST